MTRAQDVVRYIKAIEDTGGFRTVWHESYNPVTGVTGFFCTLWPTADYFRAMFSPDPVDQALAGFEYIRQRYFHHQLQW